jgi:hypothetical protein
MKYDDLWYVKNSDRIPSTEQGIISYYAYAHREIKNIESKNKKLNDEILLCELKYKKITGQQIKKPSL